MDERNEKPPDGGRPTGNGAGGTEDTNMKAIIDGRLYNTDTAEEICDISPDGYSRGDFRWEDTRLYRTKKGAFFIAGHGGAYSRWSVSIGQNLTGPGNGIRPIDEADARKMVERHATPERFVEIFGAVEEA